MTGKWKILPIDIEIKVCVDHCKRLDKISTGRVNDESGDCVVKRCHLKSTNSITIRVQQGVWEEIEEVD